MALDDQQIAQRFAALTPEARREFLSKLKSAGLSFAELPIVPTERTQLLPLSYAQHSLWLTWRLDPANPAYNMPGLLHLRGVLDLKALEYALQSLVERHEILRTVYSMDDDAEPKQKILAKTEQALPLTDLRSLSSEEQTAEIRRLQLGFAQKPFQLDVEPPLRVALWRLADDQHILGLALHHIAADGGSIQILLDELFALYADSRAGKPSRLAPLPIQFADYALWQRNWFEAGEREGQLAYWCTRLGTEHIPIKLPLDRPRVHSNDVQEGCYPFCLSRELSEELRRLARTQQASLFMVILALLKLTLYRFTGQTDLNVGSPIANRQRSETCGLVGCLTNMQVLRSHIEATESFLALLAHVRERVLEAQAHPDLPFDLLVEALQPQRQLGVHPLFQVKCTQQDDLPVTRRVAGLEIRIEGMSGEAAHFDFSLDFTDQPDAIQVVLVYAAALFDESSIARFARAFEALTAQVIAQPDTPVAALTLPEPLAALYGLQTEFPHADVIDLWMDAVTHSPQRLAVRCEDRCLTYAELNTSVECLAAQLISHGVGPEVRVGIYAERSCEFVLGVLATLKAGATYVPLDPKLPAERLAYQLADSGALWLLAARNPSWQPTIPVLELAFASAQPDLPSVPKVHPQQSAYVIYTSGSTGKPKGVVISRGALANYTQAVLAQLNLPDSANSVAMLSTVAADLGHTSFFGALCSGRTLHLIDAERAFDPDRFALYMAEHSVDMLKIVPSHLQSLLQAANPAAVLPKHVLIVGGEVMPWSLLEQVRTLNPECRVINHYGPTESCVGALTQPAEAAEQNTTTVPIGRPLANLHALVLDSELNLLPPGVVGELYLGGLGLAHGYQGQAGQTAECFIAHPFEPNKRLYRTGDQVKLLNDGSLAFLGRVDDQVKVRGYRVELREIVEQLECQEGVNKAAVIAKNTEEGRTQLYGYVVAQGGEPLNLKLLREALAKSLPEYMLPAAIVQLEALPLSLNGKLDRNALPDPQNGEPQSYEPPIGNTEQALAEIWAQVLRVERVGRQDNFFELGGDSILTLQIIARARKRGFKFTPKQLMELQSIAALSTVTEVLETHTPAVSLTQGTDTAFALLPVQHWFFEQDFAEPQHWNQSLLLTATESIDFVRLRQALEWVVSHHDGLHLCFEKSQNGWMQRTVAMVQTAVCIECIDLSGEPQAAEAISRAAAAAQASLSLTQPFKAVWMDLGASRSGRLLLVAHHLVVDGVSWRILLEDLQTAYHQLEKGSRLDLPAKTTSVAVWAHALAEYAKTESLKTELAYWQRTVGTQEPCLPSASTGRNCVADARTLEIILDEDFTERLLSEVHQAYRTQINDILLTALARTLCAWDKRETVLVELEGHGRESLDNSIDLSRTIGWFTSLFPVRLKPDHDDLAASIKAIKEQLRQIPNKGLGYGVLRYLTAEGQILAKGSYPQVTFNYLGQLDQSFATDALWRLARESTGNERALSSQRRTWLEISALTYRDTLRLRWTYSTALHSEATVQCLAERFQQELKTIIDHCTNGAMGITPNDFPLAKAAQVQLDCLPIPLGKLADLYPLSPMQMGMLFQSTYNPNGTAYVNQLRIDINGLEPNRFKAAWQRVFDRHAVLRTGFVQGEVPLQWVTKSLEVPLTVEDWRERADKAQALDALAQTEFTRGFDLATPPLMRLILVQTMADQYHLIWTRHHLLLDGWSTSRLLAEVLEGYAGQPTAVASGHFRDYIAWLQTQNIAASESYWRSLTAALTEPTTLATALSPVRDSTQDYLFQHQLFDEAELVHLLEFARCQRVTLNTLVQATWALLLHRYTGQDTLCFGATTAGRPMDLLGAEQMLGLFINTLPVVIGMQPQQHIGQWLRSLQAQNVASREHEHTPLFEIQRWAGLGGRGLFDTILVFENYPMDEVLRQTQGQSLEFKLYAAREETHYPMTVVVQQIGQTLAIKYAFQSQCFSPEQVKQLVEHFRELLLSLTLDPERYLGEMECLSTSERRQLTQRSGASWSHSEAKWVHHLIEQQARERAQATALIFEDKALSYTELNCRANQLAHRLIRMGVRPEVKVGIAVERSLDMMLGILGILKAGGAYVPLDPDYPDERLTYMVEDSGIRLLLTQSHLAGRISSTHPLTELALDVLDLSAESEQNPHVELLGSHLAYVIYTSGSTG